MNKSNRPKPILTMWMPEYSDDNRPWYDIDPIVKPPLKPEELRDLRYTIKAIDFFMSREEYQIVLNRASEKGLYDYVEEVLNMERGDLDLDLSRALYLAAINGHEHIVLLLLHYDFENENSPFYLATLLTRGDLIYTIRHAVVAGYPEIAIMIQKYYYEMYEDKNEYAGEIDL